MRGFGALSFGTVVMGMANVGLSLQTTNAHVSELSVLDPKYAVGWLCTSVLFVGMLHLHARNHVARIRLVDDGETVQISVHDLLGRLRHERHSVHDFMFLP